MEHLTNWFLGLPLQTALGVVFFGMIIIGCLAVMITDAAVKAVVQHRIAGVDECANTADDDAFSLLYHPIARDDDYFRRIDLKSFTCTLCCEQQSCPCAFDLHCTDGYCSAK